jgi:ABC-type lipoprotein export system ATPase subunit
MISLDHVTVDYGDDLKPLDDLSHTFPPGTTAVTGPSGSGKSTLLRLIAGLQRPASGTVTIDGAGVRPASWWSAGDPRVAVTHQDYRLVPYLTVAENLVLAVEARGGRASVADAEATLARVGLPAATSRRLPGTLSGGEQQRVAIARGLVAGSPVLVADEPTGALDPRATELIAGVLVDLGRDDGLTVVVATHDPGVAARMAHRLDLGAPRLGAPP